MTFGMPYMGSKQAIVDSICMNFPKSEHFYDLFGGGSITHYMMLHRAKNHAHFHYNELNPLVSNLFKRAIAGEFSYDRFKPEWISREDFFARKEQDGYVKYVWSFGNNPEQGYLFGEDIEPYKKSMHMAIVFDEFDAIVFSVLGFKEWPKDVDTIKKRRFYLRQKIEWFNKNKRIPKELHRFLSDKQLKQMGAKDNVKQLQQLQQLQQLERLQQLQQLERLTITNCSYEQVEIKPKSVVYCDIPYAGTTDYGGSFSHKAFFDWAASRDFPVYISEYNVPDQRFQLVYSIDKRAMLSSPNDTIVKIKSEKLYWNGKSL